MSRSRYHHILNHLEFMANCDDKKKRNITRNVIINTLKNYQSAKGNVLKALETENAELRERVGELEMLLNNDLMKFAYDNYLSEDQREELILMAFKIVSSPLDVEKGEDG